MQWPLSLDIFFHFALSNLAPSMEYIRRAPFVLICGGVRSPVAANGESWLQQLRLSQIAFWPTPTTQSGHKKGRKKMRKGQKINRPKSSPAAKATNSFKSSKI